MPKIVEVPGVGNVEFPDDMNDDQISSTLKQHVAVPKEEATVADDIGDTLKQYWDHVNPVKAVEGAAQMAAHPIDTIKGYGETNNKLYESARESFKKGDHAQGVRHALSYLLNAIPGLGSALDEAGNKAASGDVKGAIADTAALATQIAGPRMLEAGGKAASATAQAGADAVRAVAPAIRAGGKDVAIGAGKVAAGSALAGYGDVAGALTGSPLIGGGLKQVATGLGSGYKALKASIAERKNPGPPLAGPVLVRNPPASTSVAVPGVAAESFPGEAVIPSSGGVRGTPDMPLVTEVVRPGTEPPGDLVPQDWMKGPERAAIVKSEREFREGLLRKPQQASAEQPTADVALPRDKGSWEYQRAHGAADKLADFLRKGEIHLEDVKVLAPDQWKLAAEGSGVDMPTPAIAKLAIEKLEKLYGTKAETPAPKPAPSPDSPLSKNAKARAIAEQLRDLMGGGTVGDLMQQ